MKKRQLLKLGIPEGEPLESVLGALPDLAAAGVLGKELRTILRQLATEPGSLLDHPQLGCVAATLQQAASSNRQAAHVVKGRAAHGDKARAAFWGKGRAAQGVGDRAAPVPCRIWGEGHEASALAQLEDARSLPVSVAAALMPDAHQGYGLPIGGVLATRNAVIPYAVGVDIACRMRLSVLDWPPSALEEREGALIEALERETRFGVGAEFGARERREHAVMDADWRFDPVVARERNKAWAQLGSSGGGNHFAEFGLLTVPEEPQVGTPTVRAEPNVGEVEDPTVPEEPGLGDPTISLGLGPGRYLALLTHSGSRGTGARIAEHFSQVAARQHPELPRQLRRLAWLDLDGADGQAYWAAMSLMGRYAAANHELIHRFVLGRLGARVIAAVENHHNFAWLERHLGEQVVVHRKGATPAGPGAIGVIPGSMGTPGYVVRGLGAPESLHSASHGAGRKMSRTEALRRFGWAESRAFLKARNVRLLSGGLDEVPMAYKDIEVVMAAQADLVVPLFRFDPRLVKMAEGRRGRR